MGLTEFLDNLRLRYLTNTNVETRVKKSREHGEHAARTPKVFPRNTQGKILSKICSDSVSSHIFCENSLIYQNFPSSASSIVL